jgi:hypothetical protein
MPRRVIGVITCVCGERITLLLAGLEPAECRQCGAQYDPRTGEMLPVCDGFEITLSSDVPQPAAPSLGPGSRRGVAPSNGWSTS